MSEHGPFCPAFTAPKVSRFPAVEATGPCNCRSVDDLLAERDRWRVAENAQTDLLRRVFDALGGDPVRDTVDVLAANVKAERDRLAAQVERVRDLHVETHQAGSSSGFDLKKVYYLSGPMAGYPDNNIPAFRKAAEELSDAGILIISPHDLIPSQEDPTGVDYLANDFREMCEKCQGIILLRGWPQSQGARAELEIAMTLHWPVYYYENFTLTDMNRIPWTRSR